MSRSATPIRSLLLALPLALIAVQAGAHTGAGIDTGFASGFWHPILGWDHVVAMVAVGLWAASQGGVATWVLPLVFPLVMALGAALGVLAAPLPAIETGIALSGIVLGLLVAFAVRAPIWVAVAVVGVFAVFHGHAHGTERPAAFGPYGYAAGFLVGTALLHMVGIGLGLLVRSPVGRAAVRGTGAGIAMAGAAFLVGIA